MHAYKFRPPRLASRGAREHGARRVARGISLPPGTSWAHSNLFFGILLRPTRAQSGALHTYDFRAGAKLVLRGPADSQVGGIETAALRQWGPGDFLALPINFRAQYNLFAGVLLRSTHVIRGVLHTYDFRASAKLVPCRPPDSQEGELEATAPRLRARGISLPSP